MHGAKATVVEAHYAANIEDPINEEKIEQRVIEPVIAIHVRHLDACAVANQFGQHEVIKILDEAMEVPQSCAR